MKKNSLIISLFIAVIAGCQVDKSGLPQVQSNTLLYDTWFVKTMIIITPTVGTTPGSSSTVTSFTSKDFYIFYTNNTVKYSSSFPDTVEYNRYSYVNNASGQQLIFPDPAGGFDTYSVQKLTTDSLIFTTSATLTVNATTVVYPIIYKLAKK